MPYNVIQGIWEHLRGVEDTFEAIYHYFGPFRPNAIPLYVRSKYPKNAQNHHFRPKSWFFQSGYTCSYGRYMAGKMHLGCLRLILSAFTISGVLLVHFSEIRKKSIFWPIFCDLLVYIYTYIMVPAINRPYGFGRMLRYLKALSGSNGGR